MDLTVEKASEYGSSSTVWKVNTIEELLQKIKECGHSVIIDEDGSVLIYDNYVE